MKFPEKPRVFLSGGGSGLGRALALALARRRARILVTDVNEARLLETCELVKGLGGEAVGRVVDVTNAEEVEAAAAALDSSFGGTDIVINNAGVAVSGLIGDAPLADWKFIMDVNLWGPIHGCHVFAPRLRKQKSGFVLNVASAAGFASLPEMAAYNTTKAAVIALSETLYGELRPHGATVSVLCPTFFKTNLLESFRSPTEESKKKAEAFFKKSKMTAETVAQAALAGLEDGRLHIVPMADGRAVWRAKRLFPAAYFAGVVRGQKRVEAWLKQ